MMPDDPRAPAPQTSEQRRDICRDNQSWPERTVVRTGVSPMNPKVKYAELSCGHDVWRRQKPKIGATIVCEKCAQEKR